MNTQVTLWDSLSSIDKLNHAPLYLETVSHIEASGILTGESKTESFEYFGGFCHEGLPGGIYQSA